MLNIEILSSTATSFSLQLSEEIDFEYGKLWLDLKGSDVELGNTAEAVDFPVFSYKSWSQSFHVDLNKIKLENIYYKTFYIILYNEDNEEIERTALFSISPRGAEAFYGIANKLRHDFELLSRLSGTVLKLFFPKPEQSHCPDCWDEELQQRTMSVCATCDGSGVFENYEQVEFIARKIKTQNKQQYEDAGTDTREQVIFNTYERLDFVKGFFLIDLTDKQFYEISDRNIANIGGVRTSTTIIVNRVPAGDTRVSKFVQML